MILAPRFAPTAIRASELSRCARMAALRGLGAEHEEPDEITQRFFARGHLFGEYVARQLEAKYGKAEIEREVAIPWPLGEGHADVYVRSAKLLVEVKSTVTPTTSSPMFDMAVEQLRIYLHFHPEAERGALYLVNPSNLAGEDVFEVRLTVADRARIDADVALVRAALEGGQLPQRVCSRPGQARGRLCSFAAACFEGWVPPALHEVSAPEALDAAARLAAIKREERDYNAALAALEQGKKEAQAELGEYLPEGESVVGPWQVRRTLVQRAPVFSLKAAAAAGFPVQTLDEFMRPGAAYETFRVERAETPGEIDYGEAPF